MPDVVDDRAGDLMICDVHDPDGRLTMFFSRLRAAVKGRGRFILCLGSTEVSDLDGISAAGVNAEARRLTPAIDAEALVLGTPVSSSGLPVSPSGIVSPVVITRAALALSAIDTSVIDCGSFQSPGIEHCCLGASAARCLSTGHALGEAEVDRLFAAGHEIGEKLAEDLDFIVLAECVPGGTTTALGLLTALGHEAGRLLSSSLPTANHDLRGRLVKQGLERRSLSLEDFVRRPLLSVSAVGDPMQPVAAGIALSASARIPVLLAGGSQMMAVYALAKALSAVERLNFAASNLAVITTKWVAFDASARSAELSRLVDVPFAASCPDFHKSRHQGLRAYEAGNVKEGVGAGGSMALAFLSGFSSCEIMDAIDRSYQEMVRF